MNVIVQENCFLDATKLILRGYRVFILGAGDGAIQLYNALCEYVGENIKIEAYLVNDNYISQIHRKDILGVPVCPLSSLDKQDPNVLLLIGYGHYMFYDNELKKPDFNGVFVGEDAYFCFDKTGDGKYFDKKYFLDHYKEFDEIYDILADDKSRRVMEAYVNQKISGRLAYLRYMWEPNQYFPTDIVDLSSIDCYVDGGAYTGDTYDAFLEQYLKQTGKSYDGKAYLWEPEVANYGVLKERFESNCRVEILDLGMWNKKENLSFGGEGTGGQIMNKAETDVIKADTIDNISGGKVDFIKMDVEGAEYEALLGAIETIKRDKPKLAICAYHRRDDLLRLPKLIRELRTDYKLYLRAHTPHVQELVIYAV